MFIAELVQVLRRRWYLVLAGLLCTAAAGFLTFQSVPPTFAASADVLLLPPPASVPEGGNPYLSLSGLTPAGDVLARALSDPKVAAEIAEGGARGEYFVELDGDSPAPMVSVEAEGGSAADAATTLNAVLARLPETLRDIQAAANVPPDAFISTSQVTKTETPTKAIKPQIRALVVVVGGALVLTLLLVAAIDALLRRPRSAARRGREDEKGEAAKTIADLPSATPEQERARVQESTGPERAAVPAEPRAR